MEQAAMGGSAGYASQATGQRAFGGGSGGRRGGGGGRDGSDESEAERIVRSTIDHFERTSELSVSPRARQVLMEPATRHSHLIDRELEANEVTPFQIEDAVRTVLVNAKSIAETNGLRRIDDAEIQEAMRMECRYFPW